MVDHESVPLREFGCRVRQRLGQACRGVLLFGSRARGTARRDSDYDVMVLVDGATDEVHRLVQDIAFEIALEFDSVFSPVVFEAQSYERDRYEPLFVNVRREGVTI
jgi:predicted nucleotidyltransferase